MIIDAPALKGFSQLLTITIKYKVLPIASEASSYI